jgi:choline dehydrogenase-like flavoprotein
MCSITTSKDHYHAWRAACDKAGVPGRLVHDLRRRYGSRELPELFTIIDRPYDGLADRYIIRSGLDEGSKPNLRSLIRPQAQHRVAEQRGSVEVTQELRTDYCIAGAGPAGAVLAAKLAASGKRVALLDQGPSYSEADRSAMLRRGVETVNDYADYNDNASAATVTPHSSAVPEGQVVDWLAQRLFGVGGTALHFEGIMGRPRADDLEVRSRYGSGRDWPISYSELEPWLARAEQEVGVAGNDDNPYASPRSGPFPMTGHTFSYFDREIFGPALASLGITGHSCPRAIPTQPYRGRSECLACRACKFCPSGARYSPDRVHLRIIEGRENVTIRPGVSLRRLETDPAGDRIVAAHAIRVEDGTPRERRTWAQFRAMQQRISRPIWPLRQQTIG